LKRRSQAGVIQVIVVAGLTIFVIGLMWIILTLPLSQLIATGLANGWFDADMLLTVTFFNLFIPAFCLIVGLGVTAWGWVRTVEERETGFSTV
jgi:hypothetical protein